MAHLREFLRDYDNLVSELRDFPDKETIAVATDIAGENIKHAQHVAGFLASKMARVSSRTACSARGCGAIACTYTHTARKHAHTAGSSIGDVGATPAGVGVRDARVYAAQIRPAHAPIEA